MKRMYTAAIALAAVVALAGARPAFADDAMKGSAMADCKSLSAMAMGHGAMGAEKMAKSTGDADKDFASAMAEAHKHMMAVAKYGMSCGKSEKTKAAAKAAYEAGESYEVKFPEIMHTN